jgi:putative colanic acid biosynthesis acetyltransferase WcaF
VPRPIEAIWILVSAALVASWLPGGAHRRALLRLFGAKIGRGVIIKPGVRIKFPWRLEIGDDSWLGEEVWIDNLDSVRIGANCCISQGAYICTGSHDWSSETFDLVAKSVQIKDGAWIAARATVGPGVVVGQGAVLALGSVATQPLRDWSVYRGSPAVFLKQRRITR